ncbi:MAG: cobalamin-dependent protein [Desulfobacterales bacterium]|nr:MAG: cobalamin-dependent protein [Desulfobacterales bacterium]
MNRYSEPINVVLIALYKYQNFPIRILHSVLENIDGVEPYTIFFKNHYTNDIRPSTPIEESLFREKITELNPSIVGMSVYSPYFSVAKRLTKIIKNSSSASVVWGGIHPTLSPEMCLKEADMICMGEGEGALIDLVTSIRDGKAYHQIQNLWVNKNGNVIRNPLRPLIQDLDSIPSAAYARDSFYFIGSNTITNNDPTILYPILDIMPARGCPFGCSYCVNSLLRPMYKDLGRFVRRRTVSNVIAEMKKILAIPGNKKEIVEFQDENFGTQETWLSEFETLYPKEIGLPFKIQYNPTLIKSSTIARLKKCGLHRLKFGIEAGTDHIRNQVFTRPGKNSQMIKIAHEIAKHDVKIRYDLIMDIPYDTEESLKETINFLLQLPKPLHFNIYSLQYFPGYPLTQKALEDGYINEEDVSIDSLQERMANTWGFAPKLFPLTKKQMLQNIIWLIVYRHPSDEIVKGAVFNDSFGSKLNLIYLNFKSIFWGKIREIKRLINKKIA